MEFKLKEIKSPGEIVWNYEELKKELTDKVAFYETLVYTEEQIKDAKADRANLNKLKKALNDERLRLQREYMAPFDKFKKQVDDLIATIDRPAALIDKQVREYEEMKRQEKKETIEAYMRTFRLPYSLELETIFDAKWINATTSLASIKKEIDAKVQKIQEDLETIEDLEEYREQAIAAYSKRFDLGDAMAAVRQSKAINEQIEAVKRELQERRQEKTPEAREEKKEPERPVNGQWVSFAAYLDIQKARALKAFLEINNIEYKRI